MRGVEQCCQIARLSLSGCVGCALNYFEKDVPYLLANPRHAFSQNRHLRFGAEGDTEKRGESAAIRGHPRKVRAHRLLDSIRQSSARQRCHLLLEIPGGSLVEAEHQLLFAREISVGQSER